MVVSYLQNQLESKKPIHIAEGNIGRLFLEFLCYYGIIFDQNKYVIYTYPPSDLNFVDNETNNFFLVNTDLILLELANGPWVDYCGSAQQIEQRRQVHFSVRQHQNGLHDRFCGIAWRMWVQLPFL